MNKPQTLVHYETAHYRILNQPVRIGQKNWPTFSTLEDRLSKNSYSSLDYAETTICFLNGIDWLNKIGVKVVPIKTYAGKWLWGKYEQLKFNNIVLRLPDRDELLQSEYLAAKNYIMMYLRLKLGDRLSFKGAVQSIQEILSEDWLELYGKDERQNLINPTVERLNKEYNLIYPCNYLEIGNQIALRNVRQRKRK